MIGGGLVLGQANKRRPSCQWLINGNRTLHLFPNGKQSTYFLSASIVAQLPMGGQLLSLSRPGKEGV